MTEAIVTAFLWGMTTGLAIAVVIEVWPHRKKPDPFARATKEETGSFARAMQTIGEGVDRSILTRDMIEPGHNSLQGVLKVDRQLMIDDDLSDVLLPVLPEYSPSPIDGSSPESHGFWCTCYPKWVDGKPVCMCDEPDWGWPNEAH